MLLCAGADFMTVLGAHEGEGMVLDMEAEVAGSRGPHLASRGQRVDAVIVEVALFFQRELSAAARLGPASPQHLVNSPAGQTVGDDAGNVVPVMLISNDNGQVQLARSNGLPAVRLADLRCLNTLPRSQPLSASTLRTALLPAATKGERPRLSCLRCILLHGVYTSIQSITRMA